MEGLRCSISFLFSIAMTLKEYKDIYGVRYTKIAALCRCSVARIIQIANDYPRGGKPSLELALLIEATTDGHVSHKNWYPEMTSEERLKDAAIEFKAALQVVLTEQLGEETPVQFKIDVQTATKQEHQWELMKANSVIQSALDGGLHNLARNI
jgi:hypothetical protein